MRFILASITLASLSFGFSQEAQNTPQANKDEQELRRLENDWLASYLGGDKTTFDRIVADDFTSTDESAKLRNKAQERELVQAPPSSIKASLSNEEVQVRIYGDAAIVNGRIVAKSQPAQTEISFQSRFTDTFVKRGGEWQVVARHYSRLPLERKAVTLDPKVYDAYVGQYELGPSFIVTVTKENDKLMSQGSGQPKFELLPESEIGFFIKDFSALFIFMRGKKGTVDQLITIQDGRIIAARKIR